jgi:hypothetical protein
MTSTAIETYPPRPSSRGAIAHVPIPSRVRALEDELSGLRAALQENERRREALERRVVAQALVLAELRGGSALAERYASLEVLA